MQWETKVDGAWAQPPPSFRGSSKGAKSSRAKDPPPGPAPTRKARAPKVAGDVPPEVGSTAGDELRRVWERRDFGPVSLGGTLHPPAHSTEEIREMLRNTVELAGGVPVRAAITSPVKKRPLGAWVPAGREATPADAQAERRRLRLLRLKHRKESVARQEAAAEEAARVVRGPPRVPALAVVTRPHTAPAAGPKAKPRRNMEAAEGPLGQGDLRQRVGSLLEMMPEVSVPGLADPRVLVERVQRMIRAATGSEDMIGANSAMAGPASSPVAHVPTAAAVPGQGSPDMAPAAADVAVEDASAGAEGAREVALGSSEAVGEGTAPDATIPTQAASVAPAVPVAALIRRFKESPPLPRSQRRGVEAQALGAEATSAAGTEVGLERASAGVVARSEAVGLRELPGAGEAEGPGTGQEEEKMSGAGAQGDGLRDGEGGGAVGGEDAQDGEEDQPGWASVLGAPESIRRQVQEILRRSEEMAGARGEDILETWRRRRRAWRVRLESLSKDGEGVAEGGAGAAEGGVAEEGEGQAALGASMEQVLVTDPCMDEEGGREGEQDQAAALRGDGGDGGQEVTGEGGSMAADARAEGEGGGVQAAVGGGLGASADDGIRGGEGRGGGMGGERSKEGAAGSVAECGDRDAASPRKAPDAVPETGLGVTGGSVESCGASVSGTGVDSASDADVVVLEGDSASGDDLFVFQSLDTWESVLRDSKSFGAQRDAGDFDDPTGPISRLAHADGHAAGLVHGASAGAMDDIDGDWDEVNLFLAYEGGDVDGAPIMAEAADGEGEQAGAGTAHGERAMAAKGDAQRGVGGADVGRVSDGREETGAGEGGRGLPAEAEKGSGVASNDDEQQRDRDGAPGSEPAERWGLASAPSLRDMSRASPGWVRPPRPDGGVGGDSPAGARLIVRGGETGAGGAHGESYAPMDPDDAFPRVASIGEGLGSVPRLPGAADPGAEVGASDVDGQHGSDAQIAFPRSPMAGMADGYGAECNLDAEEGLAFLATEEVLDLSGGDDELASGQLGGGWQAGGGAAGTLGAPWDQVSARVAVGPGEGAETAGQCGVAVGGEAAGDAMLLSPEEAGIEGAEEWDDWDESPGGAGVGDGTGGEVGSSGNGSGGDVGGAEGRTGAPGVPSAHAAAAHGSELSPGEGAGAREGAEGGAVHSADPRHRRRGTVSFSGWKETPGGEAGSSGSPHRQATAGARVEGSAGVVTASGLPELSGGPPAPALSQGTSAAVEAAGAGGGTGIGSSNVGGSVAPVGRASSAIAAKWGALRVMTWEEPGSAERRERRAQGPVQGPRPATTIISLPRAPGNAGRGAGGRGADAAVALAAHASDSEEERGRGSGREDSYDMALHLNIVDAMVAAGQAQRPGPGGFAREGFELNMEKSGEDFLEELVARELIDSPRGRLVSGRPGLGSAWGVARVGSAGSRGGAVPVILTPISQTAQATAHFLGAAGEAAAGHAAVCILGAATEAALAPAVGSGPLPAGAVPGVVALATVGVQLQGALVAALPALESAATGGTAAGAAVTAATTALLEETSAGLAQAPLNETSSDAASLADEPAGLPKPSVSATGALGDGGADAEVDCLVLSHVDARTGDRAAPREAWGGGPEGPGDRSSQLGVDAAVGSSGAEGRGTAASGVPGVQLSEGAPADESAAPGTSAGGAQRASVGVQATEDEMGPPGGAEVGARAMAREVQGAHGTQESHGVVTASVGGARSPTPEDTSAAGPSPAPSHFATTRRGLAGPPSWGDVGPVEEEIVYRAVGLGGASLTLRLPIRSAAAGACGGAPWVGAAAGGSGEEPRGVGTGREWAERQLRDDAMQGGASQGRGAACHGVAGDTSHGARAAASGASHAPSRLAPPEAPPAAGQGDLEALVEKIRQCRQETRALLAQQP